MNEKHFVILALVFSFLIIVNTIPAYAESITLTKTHSYRLVDDNNATCGDAVSSGTVSESGSAFFTRYVVYYPPIRCDLSIVEWDISSIPSGAIISDVSVRGTGSGTGATSCDVMSFPNQRSSYTDSELVSRLASNTDRIADNSSVCTSSGMVSLGTDAITYMQSQIDNGIITVTMGAMYDDRSINERRLSTSTSTSELTITYTAPAQDTTSPVITLSGDNPQTVEFGNSYTELGAICTDVVDGNISNIVIDSTGVDASVVGTYSVTYDCADSSENNAMQVTRTVNIVDTTPPIIILTGSNPQTIEIGNGYTELGATTDDGSPVTIDSSSFVDSIGSYTITYNSVDSSGNHAVTVTRTVNVVDVIVPGQENIIVSDVKPCFLLENQTVLSKLKKCGFGDDFLVYSFTGFEWITGGNFTLAIASILILFSYVKYHKASYPLIIGVAMLPISYNFFPVEFLSFAFVMTALVLTVLCWHIFIRQTKEY